MKPTILTFNAHNINDGTSSYRANFPYETPLQGTQPNVNFVKRAGASPAYAGKDFGESYITVRIIVLGAVSGINAKVQTLNQWFNVYDETPYQLIIQDEDDSAKQYYVYATPKSITGLNGREIQITLARKDPIWQSVTQNSTAWNITASGQTQAITAGGNIEAYPVLEFTPTSYASGGYLKQLYITMYPTSDFAYPNRPLDVTGAWDTAALVSGGDLQADGDDVRLMIDGVESNYWYGGGGINTSTTRVWTALDIPARCEVTLKTALNNSTTPATIDVVYGSANAITMNRIPAAGRLYIDTEEFSYTGKTVTGTTLNFTGIVRELRGTTIASHSAAATIRWIPFDISIVYKNSAATAMVTDDARKPVIDMAASTNSSFVWTEFVGTGTNGNLRAGSWQESMTNFVPPYSYTYYGVNDAATVPDPADVMGGAVGVVPRGTGWMASNSNVYWTLYMPDACTVISSNGSKYRSIASWANAVLLSSSDLVLNGGVPEWTEASPSAATTWETWTHSSESVPAGTKRLTFWFGGQGLSATVGNITKFEVTGATVTITNAPSVTLRTSTAVLKVNGVITNTTTGQYINVSYPLQSTKTLVIDTDPNNPSAKVDGQIISGISPDTIRSKWLPLQVGSNTLTFTSDSTGNVTLTVKWRDRINML